MAVFVPVCLGPGGRTRRWPNAAGLTLGPAADHPFDSTEHDMTTSASTSTAWPGASSTGAGRPTNEVAAVRESNLEDARRLLAAVRRLHHRLGGDSGQITPFAIVMIITMMAVGGLVLDAGLALSQKVRALDLAQAAARAGAQKLNLYEYRTSGVAELDPPSATATARAWPASAGVDGT